MNNWKETAPPVPHCMFSNCVVLRLPKVSCPGVTPSRLLGTSGVIQAAAQTTAVQQPSLACRHPSDSDTDDDDTDDDGGGGGDADAATATAATTVAAGEKRAAAEASGREWSPSMLAAIADRAAVGTVVIAGAPLGTAFAPRGAVP